MRLLAAAVLALALGGCAGLSPQSAPDPQAAAGASFVARACAGCHAVGGRGDSRDPAAPPFRGLATSLPDGRLQADLARVAQHGHGQMPPIYMTDDEQAAVLACLRRLRPRA